VDLVLHKLVGTLEQLSGEDDNRGSAIANLSVLDLGELNEDLGSGVLNFELLENGGTIIGNGNITDVIDEHLVETLRAERALNDIREGLYSHN
jgi:hypothetical protein